VAGTSLADLDENYYTQTQCDAMRAHTFTWNIGQLIEYADKGGLNDGYQPGEEVQVINLKDLSWSNISLLHYESQYDRCDDTTCIAQVSSTDGVIAVTGYIHVGRGMVAEDRSEGIWTSDISVVNFPFKNRKNNIAMKSYMSSTVSGSYDTNIYIAGNALCPYRGMLSWRQTASTARGTPYTVKAAVDTSSEREMYFSFLHDGDQPMGDFTWSVAIGLLHVKEAPKPFRASLLVIVCVVALTVIIVASLAVYCRFMRFLTCSSRHKIGYDNAELTKIGLGKSLSNALIRSDSLWSVPSSSGPWTDRPLWTDRPVGEGLRAPLTTSVYIRDDTFLYDNSNSLSKPEAKTGGGSSYSWAA
jgi:hypothetical protein